MSPFAYVGAAAAITSLWTLLLGRDWKDTCKLYAKTLLDAIDLIEPKLSRWDFRDLFPNPSEFWKYFTNGRGKQYLLASHHGGLQGMLTALHEYKELVDYKSTLSPGDRARICSASQKFASRWLRSSVSDTKLNNEHFVEAVAIRIGTPGEQASDPASALSNPKVAFTLKNLRHKFIAECVAKWSLRAGAERAETEPKDLWLDNNKRPDIDLILGSERYLVDVAVVHPTSPTYVLEARNPLGGSADMALTKEEKYAEMALRVDATVVPAILETYGAIGDNLIDLCKQIAKYASINPYRVWSSHEIYNGLLLETSLILQQWNAKIMLVGKAQAHGDF